MVGGSFGGRRNSVRMVTAALLQHLEHHWDYRVNGPAYRGSAHDTKLPFDYEFEYRASRNRWSMSIEFHLFMDGSIDTCQITTSPNIVFGRSSSIFYSGEVTPQRTLAFNKRGNQVTSRLEPGSGIKGQSKRVYKEREYKVRIPVKDNY